MKGKDSPFWSSISQKDLLECGSEGPVQTARVDTGRVYEKGAQKGKPITQEYNYRLPDLGVDPNKIKATTIGPMVVPKELMPPARFNRCAPFSASPNEMANGLAAVCCNEKPSPTINSAPNT